jgi:hypothetical protein
MDFLVIAKRYMDEARAMGIHFAEDGTFTLHGKAPWPRLPSDLEDHLRVLRSAIAVLVKEENAR